MSGLNCDEPGGGCHRSDQLRDLSEVVIELRRLPSVLEGLEERLDRLSEAINATDRARPGIALRVDRLETQFERTMGLIKWTFGGGLAAALATLVTLAQIARSLP